MANLVAFLLSLALVGAIQASTHSCNLGSSSNVDSAFKSCCSGASSGQSVRLVINKSVKDVGPFSFHCDHSELFVNPGVTLTSSTNGKDFSDAKAWINSDGQKDITIAGTGTIDGSGKVWWDGASHRHMFAILDHNNGLTVKDITLQNSPHWTLVVKRAENVLISNITINNPYTSPSHNLDCIDIGGSNIHIKGGTLHCGDDNISIKGGCSNFLAEDMVFETGHGASIGSITSSKVTNITFTGLTMNGPDNGCRIKTKTGYTGGLISDVVYNSITMKNTGHDLVIDGTYESADRYEEYGDMSKMTPSLIEWIKEIEDEESPPHLYTGNRANSAPITNIKFKHISATKSQKPATLQCNPDQACTDVLLYNVDIDSDASCKYVVKSHYEGTVKPSSLYKGSTCSFTEKSS